MIKVINVNYVGNIDFGVLNTYFIVKTTHKYKAVDKLVFPCIKIQGSKKNWYLYMRSPITITIEYDFTRKKRGRY